MDNIVVGVRVRPLNQREKSAPGFKHAWDVGNNTISRAETHDSPSRGEAHKFNYDSVFEPSSTNDDVYSSIGSPIVEAALSGFNATIFAYGQTSSGKTHTMLGSDDDPGVTPRAIEHVLRTAAASKTRRFHIRASYVEIYNDKIHDLQNAGRNDLAIRQDKAGRVYVEAEETIVETLKDAMAILENGQNSRHVGETKMNARSSRSHTVFSLMIESKDDVGNDRTIRASTLNLVDLAGSERIKSTGAEGQRRKEGAHINKSLLVLGNIINKLSKFGNDPSKLGHLPYRESKLTRLLRPALGGNAKTAVLCAMTPSNWHVEETLSTLKFAERAKKITNNAARNEIVDYRAKYKQTAVEMEVLKERYAALEKENAKLKKSASTPIAVVDCPPPSDDVVDSAVSPASTLTDVPSPALLSTPESSEASVVVNPNVPSMAEVVGLRLDVDNLRDELEYMKKHVDEVEIENEHLRAQLRKKNSEYRDLRTRTVELRQAARQARQKERETGRALVLAFTKLEEARAQLEASRKKGAHVKVAEQLLDELSTSLLDWLPQSMDKRSSSSASGSTTALPTDKNALSTVPADARAQLAREIGRDSQRGKAILAQFASVAGAASRTYAGTTTTNALPAPERRRRARTLPEDLVMDIDDEEAEAQAGNVDSSGATPVKKESQSESAVGEDITIHGKYSGWKSFKSFYGYGMSRSKDLADVVSGHQISSASRHISA